MKTKIESWATKTIGASRNLGSLGLDGETTVRAKHLHIKDILF
jgi:hypothetical protein